MTLLSCRSEAIPPLPKAVLNKQNLHSALPASAGVPDGADQGPDFGSAENQRES